MKTQSKGGLTEHAHNYTEDVWEATTKQYKALYSICNKRKGRKEEATKEKKVF